MQIDWQEIAAEHFADDLARRLLAVPWQIDEVETHLTFAFGEHAQADQARLLAQLMATAPPPQRPGRSVLVDILLRSDAFRSAFWTLYWGAYLLDQRGYAAELVDRPIADYTLTADRIALALASGMLAVPFERDALRRSAEGILGPATRADQRRLVAELLRDNPATYPPRHEWLVTWLLSRPAFHRAIARVRRRPDQIRVPISPPAFQPVPRLAGLDVPRLKASGDLARWLGLLPGDLDWLADERRQQGRTAIPVLQHYTYAFIPKRTGPPRLIERPKPRLRSVQRRILDHILAKVPVHDAAYGFVPGRSCVDAAARHVGEAVVVGCDLESFFTSIRSSRINALFRSIGYPPAVARLLTGLVTTTTPASVLARACADRRHSARVAGLHARPHLPQGAPTSPALSNLAAWRLDCRLEGLACRFEARYTRYADDITFSGGDDLAGSAASLLRAINEIVTDEGFALNPAKTRVMRRHARQQVTGIVVNEQMSVARCDFDALKAILHNARHHGWQSQNRAGHPDFRAHLDGRIAWVERLAPRRGARLRSIFNAIEWRNG